MNAFTRLLGNSLGAEPIDAWLSRWGCSLGAVVLPGLAVAVLREYASTPFEFLLGVGRIVRIHRMWLPVAERDSAF